MPRGAVTAFLSLTLVPGIARVADVALLGIYYDKNGNLRVGVFSHALINNNSPRMIMNAV